jgi:enterochelin esterase family protein
MKISAMCMGFVLLFASASYAANTDNLYLLGPDSAPHDGVPQGKVTTPVNIPSKAFPDTSHMYTVYVPAQYDPAKPAALMIFMDGHAFADISNGGEYKIPNVFDNLIYRREIPITIAVFFNPGHYEGQPDFSASNWDANSNRPDEYNSLDDRFTHVVMDELMPELKKAYNISENPDDHAMCGASSGAIAAFTVAWHRPDAFHKVISTIGSFTAIRGGDAYPKMILDADAKPIRIFFEDGLNDMDTRGLGGGTYNPATGKITGGTYNPGRDWHGQNIRMVQALTTKHYDVNYAFTLSTHSNKPAGALMPEMLRWLWRDYAIASDDPTAWLDHQPLGDGGKPVQLNALPSAGRGGGGGRGGRAGRGARGGPATAPGANPAAATQPAGRGQ